MSTRQLILAAATGYSWPQIEPFVASLRATGFRGKVVMLVDKLTAADRHALQQAGIGLHRVRPLLPRLSARARSLLFNRRLRTLYRAYPAFCDSLPQPRVRRILKGWLGRTLHHIACSRYFHYLAYLEAHACDYDEVMLTDVRDVIFQADPFSFPLAAPQRFFLEHPSVTIGGQINNHLWIRRAYGEAVFTALAERRVSCSGITFGTTSGMLDYLAAMTDELSRITFPVAGADGYDQGTHNFLLWNGRFPQADLRENFQGAVATLQHVPDAEIRTDTAGRLLNSDGTAVPVLHQYDRHPAHCTRLRALLA